MSTSTEDAIALATAIGSLSGIIDKLAARVETIAERSYMNKSQLASLKLKVQELTEPPQ